MASINSALRTYEFARRNYEEVVQFNSRLTDRATVILGTTVAAYGLLFDAESLVLASPLAFRLVLVSVLALAMMFVVGCWLMRASLGEVPGTFDPGELWSGSVADTETNVQLEELDGIANLTNDICVATKHEVERGRQLGRSVNWLLCIAAIAVLTLSIGQLVQTSVLMK